MHLFSRPVLAAALLAIAGCGVNAQIGHGGPPTENADLTLVFNYDLNVFVGDLAAPPNACGDHDPGCMTLQFGPPAGTFVLQSDPAPDPNASDTGVDRDASGYLRLSSSHANFNYVWIANSADWNIGTVSKLDSKTVKETARYFTVTCFSSPGGSRASCDGTNGCCSSDDYVRFQNRNMGQPSGPHQAVQLNMNVPSRTAVDFNGDMWVANRAFGGQSSATKIANDPSECVDRNGTPGIQTSRDVNGDGLIDSDCNQNGVPDDIADVKATPCTNGMPQEFYGFDDECVLLTTNTNTNNMYGRPLALGPGAVAFGPSDAWAGGFNNGLFFRIDGATGQTKAQGQVGASPYGAVVDKNGILWADQIGGPNLYYFDTAQPAMSGTARACTFGNGAYGITIDREQNVWLGGYPDGNAYRYTPDRSRGFAGLGSGYWTQIVNPGGVGDIGRGIAADSRTPQKFWVWMGRHPNYVIRIPGDLPPPNGADQQVDGTNAALGFLAIPVAGSSPAGAGVDIDQNIWGIASTGSVATRIQVDGNGNPTNPSIAGCAPGNVCPAGGGDCCPLQFVHPNGGTTNPDPVPYTYSDFTGFGLRNFTNPKGSYSRIQKGCKQGDTRWVAIRWDADLPPQTQLTARARSGPSPTPDGTWGAWSPSYPTSPGDLRANPPLAPNPAPYLQVEFDLSTNDPTTTPRLKDFTVVWECLNGIG